jgi:hypothetical protein
VSIVGELLEAFRKHDKTGLNWARIGPKFIKFLNKRKCLFSVTTNLTL